LSRKCGLLEIPQSYSDIHYRDSFTSLDILNKKSDDKPASRQSPVIGSCEHGNEPPLGALKEVRQTGLHREVLNANSRWKISMAHFDDFISEPVGGS
jgi:hypothetical protein